MWDHPLIRKATWVATKAHTGQKRWQDVPFIIHPFRVAMLTAMDDERPEAIATALLHDVLEDTDCNLLEMPGDVRLYVECLTEIAEVKDRKQRRMDSLVKLDYVQSSIPTLVKMADRLDNLRDAALTDDHKSFTFYRESTEVLLQMGDKHAELKDGYVREELWMLMHGWINEGQKAFDKAKEKMLVKVCRGHQHRMLYPGPGADGTSF